MSAFKPHQAEFSNIFILEFESKNQENRCLPFLNISSSSKVIKV